MPRKDGSSIDEHYSKVDDIYSKDEFQEKIDEIGEKYERLFNREALAHIIVAEHDRNDESMNDICEVEPGEEATIQGKVIDLGKLRTFEKNSGEGRVRNVRLDDGTGSIKLVLWDEETEMVGDEIRNGEDIRVINGYVQDRGYGLQIQPGKWGKIELMVDSDGEEKD